MESNQNQLTIEKYSQLFINEISNPSINMEALTSQYYQMLKTSSNEKELNENIINEISSKVKIENLSNQLKKIFNKSSSLSEEQLRTKINQFQDAILGGVKNQNANEIYSISINESKEIIREEIMDWNYFSSHFDKGFEHWQIKEALGWIAGYIETEDYNPNKIIVMNGNQINKKQTLKNILTDINKKSLTEKQPFITRGGDLIDENGNLRFGFRGASAGEVDVMLWSEKKQKAIALSVTRDRSIEVDGNQFLRHYTKMLTDIAILKREKGENVSRTEARNFFKSVSFKENRRKIPNNVFRRLDREAKEEVYKKIEANDGVKHISNKFFKDLILLREERARKDNYINPVDYSTKTIDKSEVESLIKEGKKNVEYIYFGESIDKKNDFLNRIMVSLNSFAYVNNFNKLGNINLGFENGFNYLKTMDFKYNTINEGDLVTEGLGNTLQLLNMHISDFQNVAVELSEGRSYRAERINLLKSIDAVFNILNGVENKEEFLLSSGMDTKVTQRFLNNLKDESFVEDLKEKLELIKYSQSELSNHLDNTIANVENFILKENKKTIEEFLMSKNISMSELNQFKKMKNNSI